MKKVFITAGLVILAAVAVITAIMLISRNSADAPPAEAETESRTEYTQKPSTDINVDSWLKISDIRSHNGRLAVVAENISDTDVEYALLTVQNGDKKYTFNASVLLRHKRVLLVCNEEADFDSTATYTLWKTENVISFTTPPSMNESTLEVKMLDGSVSVKNISGSDISTDIFIYYKTKTDGIPDGSITHRIKLSGLRDSAETFVNAPSITPESAEIIFTQY